MSAGVIAASAVISGGGGGGGYPTAVLADSPLAYWRLGDASGTTMTDSSGNSRNGSYVGSPTLGATGLLSGDADTAMTLSAGKYGETTSATWMNAAAFSIEALIRPSGVTGTQTVASRYDGADSGNFNGSSWTLRLDANKLTLYVFTTGGSFTSAAQSTTLSAATTYHVVGTFTGTGLAVYVNGASVGTASTGSGMNSPVTRPLRIGRSGNTTPEGFVGTIDEVAYYGTALSSTRVAAHYAAA